MLKEQAVSTPPAENRFIHQRLRAVYRFAEYIIRSKNYQNPVENHLDVGTYEGTFLPELLRFAQNVYSFDLDFEKLQKAKERKDLQPAFENNRIHLGQMMAQGIGFAPNSFDSATIVEVFGAGFEGSENDVKNVIREVHWVLAPGGILVMTVRSKSAEEVFEAVTHLDDKGLAVSRKSLKPVLSELFGDDVQWYGQVILKHNEKSFLRKARENASHILFNYMVEGMQKGKPLPVPIQMAGEYIAYSLLPKKPHHGLSLPVSVQRDADHTGHAIWDERAFRPRRIPDLTKETPGYWVGVFRKPGLV